MMINQQQQEAIITNKNEYPTKASMDCGRRESFFLCGVFLKKHPKVQQMVQSQKAKNTEKRSNGGDSPARGLDVGKIPVG